jgi:hypothetical protein
MTLDDFKEAATTFVFTYMATGGEQEFDAAVMCITDLMITQYNQGIQDAQKVVSSEGDYCGSRDCCEAYAAQSARQISKTLDHLIITKNSP